MYLCSSQDVIMILSKGINNNLFKHLIIGKNWNQVGFKPMSLTFWVSALTSRPLSPLLPSTLESEKNI